MADYKSLGYKIMQLEGGYANHPYDKGGPTMKGVTFKTFKSFFGEDSSLTDLLHITDEQWFLIFKTGYWDAVNADNIINQSIADIVVDFAYMSGPRTAIKKIQKALKLKCDGVVGPDTLNMLNGSDPELIFETIKEARRKFFDDIVAKDIRQLRFKQGWYNRLNKFNFEK